MEASYNILDRNTTKSLNIKQICQKPPHVIL